MTDRPCTHTSDWWKEMLPCVCCGAMYSDEEADAIANDSRSHGGFSAAQQAIIDRLEAESEVPHDAM